MSTERLSAALLLVAVLVAACSEPATSSTTASGPGTSNGAGSTTTSTTFVLPEPDAVDDVLARCPTTFDVEFVTSRVALVFDGDPTAPALVCEASDGSVDLTRLEERVIRAVLMMEASTFEEPLPWTDLALLDWFASAVDGIRFRDDIDLSFCCEPDGHINIPTGDLAALDTTRWIDPATGAGLIDLIALLVHEARHAEGFTHTCPDGMNDETVTELGPWGVESLVYRWYADHADLRFFEAHDRPGFYAEAAALSADRILDTRFCDSGG